MIHNANLSEFQKKILIMRHQKGLTNEIIADTCGYSVATIKKEFSKIHTKIYKALEENYE